MRPPVSPGRIRSEAGFTIVEMLVAIALFITVFAVLLVPLEYAQTQTPKDVEWAHSVADGTTGLQRMMREIRQAYRINGTNADPTTGKGSMIDFYAILNGTDQEIEYDCSQHFPTNTGNSYASQYYRCMRVSVATGGALPAISTGTIVIDRVLNPNLFTFFGGTGATNSVYPTYVEATVQVPARGPLNTGLTHTITLDAGTSIPNLENGG
ncbi:MAG: prepilin-type N-terminal cleavage/methylation domain-containing protein [Solirubrobacteraceae bacterium]